MANLSKGIVGSILGSTFAKIIITAVVAVLITYWLASPSSDRMMDKGMRMADSGGKLQILKFAGKSKACTAKKAGKVEERLERFSKVLKIEDGIQTQRYQALSQKIKVASVADSQLCQKLAVTESLPDQVDIRLQLAQARLQKLSLAVPALKAFYQTLSVAQIGTLNELKKRNGMMKGDMKDGMMGDMMEDGMMKGDMKDGMMGDMMEDGMMEGDMKDGMMEGDMKDGMKGDGTK